MSMKKPVDKKIKREPSKDDIVGKKPDEKLKKSIYSVSTPRNFIQKSSAADIYAKKDNVQIVKAPKKSSASIKTSSNTSPMKDLLKSSPSNVSLLSTRSYRTNKSINDTKTSSARDTEKSRKTGVAKKLPFNNITVNSPIAKKKLPAGNDQVKIKENKGIDVIPRTKSFIVDRDDFKAKEKEKTKELTKDVVKRKEIIDKKLVLPERRRTKTRTLEEEEIKILTPDVVDNNFEILNLTKQLSAQPKAFYVGLNEENSKPKPSNDKTKESDEEVSYEDDFESYESDFDSYQSDGKISPDDDHDCQSNDDDHDCGSDDSNHIANTQENYEVHSKEESMLDSGNFDLRDARSVGKSKPLNYILEDSQETDKKISLTSDEGFQEISSSSGLSSMKTVHIDVLDRPLFIDFTKSKENRRKRKIFERLKQRAVDILSMVTLHEMSYDLYEMKPIPYDLYMATFGRFNYTQTAVQTFDDGINVEAQTDDILVNDKWTQNPIEFSNHYFKNKEIKKKESVDNFAFLIDSIQNDTNDIIDDNYKINPLRIYLEQKDGVGSNDILPYETYKSKLKNDEYDVKKLRKFLKKFESKISNVLSNNSGNSMTNLVKTSKFPFSKEYLLITTRDIKGDQTSFLNNSQIITAIFSDIKTNLIITVHNKSSNMFKKCILCLWDLSVAMLKPLKILIATDNVKIGKFKGSTDGFIVGALNDGTILLWDLTEDPTWWNDIAHVEKTSKMVETETKINTEKEIEDVQNVKQHILQACAYTSSGMNLCNSEQADSIVGLEFMGQHTTFDYERKILAQLCALQSIGILTIWSVIQEKTKNLKPDIGKAFWSKMKLERNQSINLLQHIDLPIDLRMSNATFNLNSAKKRMSQKRNERNRGKISRPKSAISNVNIKCQDDSSNVSSKRNMVDDSNVWESGVVCNHLKIMSLNGVENYLVAKNGGELLCCRRHVGSLKVKTLSVASAASSVTFIEASPHGLPYFLAATDCGTVNMCSLLDYRVLLILDCRNGPSSVIEKCQSDHKGRYLGSVAVKPNNLVNIHSKQPITTVTWLHLNPFCIMATMETGVVVWELTYSDIKAKCKSDGVACATNERSLALLTKEGDVQVFKLTESKENCLELFQKYVALL